MNETIKVKHSDIEIEYSERDNKWRAEIRGRERSFDSLEKAREAIDKPEPTEKKPFTRVNAWKKDYAGGWWRECVVTSVAETTSSNTYLWVLCEGCRSKENSTYIFEDTAINREHIENQRKMMAEIKNLQESLAQEIKSMTMVKV